MDWRKIFSKSSHSLHQAEECTTTFPLLSMLSGCFGQILSDPSIESIRYSSDHISSFRLFAVQSCSSEQIWGTDSNGDLIGFQLLCRIGYILWWAALSAKIWDDFGSGYDTICCSFTFLMSFTSSPFLPQTPSCWKFNHLRYYRCFRKYGCFADTRNTTLSSYIHPRFKVRERTLFPTF